MRMHGPLERRVHQDKSPLRYRCLGEPSIHKDFGLAVDGGNHLWEHSQSGWSAIQLTSPMVGDDHCGYTFVYRTPGIFGSEHPFDDHRPGPDALEPANVFPGDDRPSKSSRDIDEGHRSFTWNNDVL